jgi:hypothetical protein
MEKQQTVLPRLLRRAEAQNSQDAVIHSPFNCAFVRGCIIAKAGLTRRHKNLLTNQALDNQYRVA